MILATGKAPCGPWMEGLTAKLGSKLPGVFMLGAQLLMLTASSYEANVLCIVYGRTLTADACLCRPCAAWLRWTDHIHPIPGQQPV